MLVAQLLHTCCAHCIAWWHKLHVCGAWQTKMSFLPYLDGSMTAHIDVGGEGLADGGEPTVALEAESPGEYAVGTDLFAAPLPTTVQQWLSHH